MIGSVSEMIRAARPLTSMVVAFALSSVAAGCKTSDGCDLRVEPGPDDVATVQAMFDDAANGETLCFSPGTYRLDTGVRMRHRDRLTVRGLGLLREDVVLDFSSMAEGSRALDARGARLVIEHLEVRNARSHGVFVSESDDVTLRDLSIVSRAGEPTGTGIDVILATRVRIESSEIHGAGTGIRVERSDRLIVSENVIEDCRIGIVLENAADCVLRWNVVTHTATGIFAFHQQGISPASERLLIDRNVIRETDRIDSAANFSGVGVALLAVDDVEVRDNDIRDNDTAGIMVASYELLLPFGPGGAGAEHYPDRVWIHLNTWGGNGAAPHPAWTMIAPTLEDVVWDGSLGGTHTAAPDALCLDDDECSYLMASVSDRYVSQSTDRTSVACEGAAVVPAFD